MHPTVLWAQRDEHIWLTVDLSNAEAIKVDISSTKLTFSCKADGKDYEFELTFFAPIVESESKYLKHRLIDIVLQKEEASEWPRLTAQSGKLSWLKVDWSKWQDSDAEDEPAAFDMGGMGGLPGMGGMGGMGGFPDMGGMGGFPGMAGMGGMDGLPDFSAFTQGADSDDDEDDELPDLAADESSKTSEHHTKEVHANDA